MGMLTLLVALALKGEITAPDDVRAAADSGTDCCVDEQRTEHTFRD